MQYNELQYKTDKIHYMIHVIFENQDCEEDEVTIQYLDKDHYKVRIVDVLATENCNCSDYNCTVNIAIGQYSAVCEVLPDDPMCDESYFIFQYQQKLPMHFESIYK